MTSFEIRSTLGIAFIYILRMLGLFIVLPIMAIYLGELSPESNPLLIGLAFGIYGLTQGLFQIPFGLMSDYYGRKKMIIFGLLIFIIGSIFIYYSESLFMIIVGRALQGAGAISAVLLALLADLTTDSARTKSMAIIGASIGMTFGISIVVSPLLNIYLGFQNIFLLIALLSVLAIYVVIKYIPNPLKVKSSSRSKASILSVVTDRTFLKLDYGIFALHASQIIMFMMIPKILNDIGYPVQYHWQVYLPVFVISMILIVPMILISMRKNMLKVFFIFNVAILILVQWLFANYSDTKQHIMMVLLLYFIAFNFLEASLPSMVSRLSPKNLKGLILGAYNTSQSLGIFVGGLLGGYIVSIFSNESIFIVSGILLIVWLILMLNFIFPPNKKDMVIKIKPEFFHQPQSILNKKLQILNKLNFVEETLIFPSESYIIIKTNKEKTLDEKKVLKVIGEKNAIS
jgi:MFS family permease